jgi:hypothetical protein
MQNDTSVKIKLNPYEQQLEDAKQKKKALRDQFLSKMKQRPAQETSGAPINLAVIEKKEKLKAKEDSKPTQELDHIKNELRLLKEQFKKEKKKHYLENVQHQKEKEAYKLLFEKNRLLEKKLNDQTNEIKLLQNLIDKKESRMTHESSVQIKNLNIKLAEAANQIKNWKQLAEQKHQISLMGTPNPSSETDDLVASIILKITKKSLNRDKSLKHLMQHIAQTQRAEKLNKALKKSRLHSVVTPKKAIPAIKKSSPDIPYEWGFLFNQDSQWFFYH